MHIAAGAVGPVQAPAARTAHEGGQEEERTVALPAADPRVEQGDPVSRTSAPVVIGFPWTDEAIALVTRRENVCIDTSAGTAQRYPAQLVEFMHDPRPDSSERRSSDPPPATGIGYSRTRASSLGRTSCAARQLAYGPKT